jgi:BirA family transcriptional regulator, biotin operon repressor / biotin---[acetyl-CoA-carboxylase] ligase
MTVTPDKSKPQIDCQIGAAASMPVVAFETVDSTNQEAFRRITSGERGPVWLLAREQTAGRGRSGRSWASEPGNFYGSLMLCLDCSPSVAHQLSLLAGVVVFDALAEIAGGPIPGLRLKWPNDLLLDGAKLAGILPESTTDMATGQLLAVIGIGINLEHAPQGLNRPVAALSERTSGLLPRDLIGPLSGRMFYWLKHWKNGAGFDTVRAAWLDRGGKTGELMQVNTGTATVAGRFQNLDGDGALLLQLGSGEIRRFTFGDVSLAADGVGNGRPSES